MRKVFILFLVLGISSSAFALNTVVQNQVKTTAQRAANGALSQDWFTAANWNGAVGVPQNDTATQCNGVTLYGSSNATWSSAGAPDAIVIANGNAQTGELRVGSSSTVSTGNPAALRMDSGTLTIGSAYSTTAYVSGGSGFMSVGSDSAAAGSTGRNGLFYMNGGSIQALNGQGAITIGNGNATGANCFGYMWMTGGSIESLIFRIGRYAGVTGAVYLSGGTITTNTFTMGTGTASLEISGTGKLILNGDQTTLVQGYIDNGWINDNVQMSLTMNPGKTTVYVIPEPATICLLGLGALSLMRRKK